MPKSILRDKSSLNVEQFLTFLLYLKNYLKYQKSFIDRSFLVKTLLFNHTHQHTIIYNKYLKKLFSQIPYFKKYEMNYEIMHILSVTCSDFLIF